MKTLLLVILFLSFLTLQAQSNIVSAGGKATGADGSSTFSVGQIAYHSLESEAFSVSDGLQQPIEIVALATHQVTAIHPRISIYPNPSFSGFYIVLPVNEKGNSTYELSDSSGKQIRQGKTTTTETFVATDNLTSGVYLLKINTFSGSSFSYKIIKQ